MKSAMIRLSSASVVTALLLVPTGARAGVPVTCDSFDDGVIDSSWMVLSSDPAIIAPVEQNGHLEFPAAPSGVVGAFAGVASLWTLNAFQDFRVRVDYTLNAPPVGEVGLSFAVVFEGDLRNGILTNGVTMDIGREGGDPFSCIALFINGGEDEVCEFPVVGTTMYMWYDATNDVLRTSYVQFDDPDAPAFENLRMRSDTDRVNLYLGAFTGQNAPAVSGSDLYFDDLCVEEGVIIAPPGETPEDINGDGVVDVLDLLQIILNWGDCDPGPCPADVTGDGTVNVADLVAAIVAWDG